MKTGSKRIPVTGIEILERNARAADLDRDLAIAAVIVLAAGRAPTNRLRGSISQLLTGQIDNALSSAEAMSGQTLEETRHLDQLVEALGWIEGAVILPALLHRSRLRP